MLPGFPSPWNKLLFAPETFFGKTVHGISVLWERLNEKLAPTKHSTAGSSAHTSPWDGLMGSYPALASRNAEEVGLRLSPIGLLETQTKA